MAGLYSSPHRPPSSCEAPVGKELGGLLYNLAYASGPAIERSFAFKETTSMRLLRMDGGAPRRGHWFGMQRVSASCHAHSP